MSSPDIELTWEELEAGHHQTPLTGQAIMDLELQYGDDSGPWKLKAKKSDTYEGDCTTTLTYQHALSDTYWQFQYNSNSWAEVYDEAKDIHPYEVEPYEVTVTKYRVKK